MTIKRLVFLATVLLFGWMILFYILPEVYLWFGGSISNEYTSRVNNEEWSSEVDSLLAKNLSTSAPQNTDFKKSAPQNSVGNVDIASGGDAEVTNTNIELIVFEGEEEGEELQTQVLVPGKYQSKQYLRTWGWLKRHKIDFKVLSNSELLERLARLKVDQQLFKSAKETSGKQGVNRWANAIQTIDQQQGVGKYLIPYPLNLFNNPWSPAGTLMSKNLGEVENQLVYVLKELIDRKEFFNDDEQNAYLELKKLVPEP